MSEARIAELEKQMKEMKQKLEVIEQGKKPKKEKIQREPNAYNKFIKETYGEIKQKNPEMKHTEIFAECVKKWNSR